MAISAANRKEGWSNGIAEIHDATSELFLGNSLGK